LEQKQSEIDKLENQIAEEEKKSPKSTASLVKIDTRNGLKNS
jgi:hypothetical protein